MLVTKRPTEDPATGAPSEAPSVPLIHVVEDEASIQALFHNMGRMAGFEIVTYGTVEAFFASFDAERWGCIVLDLNLPDGTGIEILERLTEQGCEKPVVLMSGMAKVSEAVAAFRLGTLDLVEKPFDLDTMVNAMRRAIEADRDRRKVTACIEGLRERFVRLTPRETQVMEYVVTGSANKEIAAHLGLSPKTVEVHRANVMRKTEANSVAELVRMHMTISDHADVP